MKNIFRKAVAMILAVTFLHVPAVANEETRALYIAPFVSSEQLSYTCKNLIDDFENDTVSWSADGGELSLSQDGACGMCCMTVSYADEINMSLTLEDANISNASGVSAVFKSNSENSVEISLSAIFDGDAYEAYGMIPPGGWYTVSLDVRKAGSGTIDAVTVKAKGGAFSIDYVHASSTHAPAGALRYLADEYDCTNVTYELTDECMQLDFNGRDAQLESGRVDRLLSNGENALSITLDNSAGLSELTVFYTETFGAYKNRNSYTCDVSDGVGTYIIPLGETEKLEGFKISFRSKPKGTVEIYDISLTVYKNTESSGKCYTDGENITVSFEGRVPDGCPVYLYRSLFAEDISETPYLSELTEEKTFVFPVYDGGKNNLLYKYTVMYEKDGELKELCRDLTVGSAEECASGASFIEPQSKKGVFGEFYREADTTFLSVDTYAFVSDTETKYSYTSAGKTYYIHTDSAEYLDRRITGISAAGGAVYICVSVPSSLGELKNEDFVYKYSAAIGYIASRYNGGEHGTVNGFVIGGGLETQTDKMQMAEILKASFDTVYASSRSENADCRLVLSLDSERASELYGFACSAVGMCPYISDIMIRCGNVKKCCDLKEGFDMRVLISSLESALGKEVGLFVHGEEYTEPYAELVRDFYSLYENSSFKCLVLDHSDAVKSGNVFRYMDTSDSRAYVGGLCSEFGLTSWDELCDTAQFSDTVRKNTAGYISYGTPPLGAEKIFTNKDGGVWRKGVGCISLSTDEKYIMASLDNSAGCGYIVFEPDKAVTVQKSTVGVKLKVDYLQAEEKNAEVFVSLVYGTRAVSCTVSVQADTDTVISLDADGVRRAEKIIIGVNGTGTPRLCVSEGFISSENSGNGELGEESANDTRSVLQDGEDDGGNTVFLLTAVLCILGAFALTGAVMWFLGKKRVSR